MSSGMFRGKESSNRIELSRLVQDLLNFGVLGSLRLWGGGRWMGGIWGHWGCPNTHTHANMYVHACTHTHAHLYMYRNCKWPLTWRHPCLACLTCMCVCVHTCVCVHACMHGTPPTHSYPCPPPATHPPPPRRVDPQISLKILITLQLIKIFQFRFRDLKSVMNSPPMGGCIIWWVGGWLGGLMGGVRSNH